MKTMIVMDNKLPILQIEHRKSCERFSKAHWFSGTLCTFGTFHSHIDKIIAGARCHYIMILSFSNWMKVWTRLQRDWVPFQTFKWPLVRSHQTLSHIWKVGTNHICRALEQQPYLEHIDTMRSWQEIWCEILNIKVGKGAEIPGQEIEKIY